MKLLTRDTDYALRALVYLAAQNGRLVSTLGLSQALKITRPHLRTLSFRLQKSGLVRSCRGKGGGLTITVRAKKASLLDVLELFQGRFDLLNCVLGALICPNIKRCLVRRKLIKIDAYVRRELASLTVVKLARR